MQVSHAGRSALAVERAPARPAAQRPRARSGPVDALKLLAAQLIVAHHLAFYGPMADVVAERWPAVVEALARHGRLAVAVFLVIGGYLAAQRLAPRGRAEWPATALPGLIAERYLRLVAPLAAVLVLAVAANAAAGRVLGEHASVSPLLGPEQVLAHLLLLQDVLGVPALTAGVWYLAIDLQLYAMLAGLLWLARRGERRVWNPQRHGPIWVAAVGAVSLLVVNRWPQADVWAPYFFGSYALGALAAWAGPGALRQWWVGGLVVAAGVVLALALQWRERVAVAAGVAALLALAPAVGGRLRPAMRHLGPAGPWARGVAERWRRGLAAAADRSYALFLIHFPVCLLVNAGFTAAAPATPGWQGLGLATAWAASGLAAEAFHRRVERPLSRWVSSLRWGRGALA